MDSESKGKQPSLNVEEEMQVRNKILQVLKDQEEDTAAVVKGIAETGINIYSFKTMPCTKDICTSHDSCHDYHSKADKRRNPLLYSYSVTLCNTVLQNTECEKKEECEEAHSVVETLFHHTKFRNHVCIGWSENRTCPMVNQICPFAHPESPDLFFHPTWQDLYVQGLINTLDFLTGAILNNFRLHMPDLQRPFQRDAHPTILRVRIMVITPSADMVQLLVQSVKDLALTCHHDIAAVTLNGKAPGTSIIIGTPTSITKMLALGEEEGKKSDSVDVGVSWSINNLHALILDDISSLLKELTESATTHVALKQVLTTPGVNKVVVTAKRNADELMCADKLLKTKLLEVIRPQNLQREEIDIGDKTDEEKSNLEESQRQSPPTVHKRGSKIAVVSASTLQKPSIAAVDSTVSPISVVGCGSSNALESIVSSPLSDAETVIFSSRSSSSSPVSKKRLGSSASKEQSQAHSSWKEKSSHSSFQEQLPPSCSSFKKQPSSHSSFKTKPSHSSFKEQTSSRSSFREQSSSRSSFREQSSTRLLPNEQSSLYSSKEYSLHWSSKENSSLISLSKGHSSSYLSSKEHYTSSSSLEQSSLYRKQKGPSSESSRSHSDYSPSSSRRCDSPSFRRRDSPSSRRRDSPSSRRRDSPSSRRRDSPSSRRCDSPSSRRRDSPSSRRHDSPSSRRRDSPSSRRHDSPSSRRRDSPSSRRHESPPPSRRYESPPSSRRHESPPSSRRHESPPSSRIMSYSYSYTIHEHSMSSSSHKDKRKLTEDSFPPRRRSSSPSSKRKRCSHKCISSSDRHHRNHIYPVSHERRRKHSCKKHKCKKHRHSSSEKGRKSNVTLLQASPEEQSSSSPSGTYDEKAESPEVTILEPPSSSKKRSTSPTLFLLPSYKKQKSYSNSVPYSDDGSTDNLEIPLVLPLMSTKNTKAAAEIDDYLESTATPCQNCRYKFDPLQEEEFLKLEAAMKKEHTSEYQVFLDAPEVHPEYNSSLDMFNQHYRERYGEVDDVEQRENLWQVFWKELIHDEQIEGWQMKREGLIDQFQIEAQRKRQARCSKNCKKATLTGTRSQNTEQECIAIENKLSTNSSGTPAVVLVSSNVTPASTSNVVEPEVIDLEDDFVWSAGPSKASFDTGAPCATISKKTALSIPSSQLSNPSVLRSAVSTAATILKAHNENQLVVTLDNSLSTGDDSLNYSVRNEISPDFSLTDSLALILEVCDSLGEFFGSVVKKVMQKVGEMGNTKEAFLYLGEADTVKLLSVTAEKLKHASTDANEAHKNKLMRCCHVIQQLIDYVSNSPHLSENKVSDLNISHLAEATLNKETSAIVKIIKETLKFYGVKDPSVELINKVHAKVSSWHLRAALHS